LVVFRFDDTKIEANIEDGADHGLWICCIKRRSLRTPVPVGRLSSGCDAVGAEAMTEWNAAEYARISALQAAMAEEVLGLLRGRLRGDERVLGAGCGKGKVTREIAPLVPQGGVLGVDSSTKMIDLARAPGAT